ncbi:MAG: tetratricopeptide repeat protein, partial [Verrucomicrobiota bacterium]
HPGDLYNQHFSLSLPDQPGLYYPDGQIRDEVYVYASFMMSSMGHAGVTCMDCHDPHTNANILPVANNSLCQRCHESGLDNAPIINPVEHSHHAAGSTGNQCVECHMPHTTYMQRDPRRDHGFLSPDPLLTRELGIPNACNSCHTDESVDWAVEWSEKWYGDKLAEKIQRKRARALSAAYAYEPGGSAALLTLIEEDVNRPWRATYTGLLTAYLNEPGVIEYLESALKDESSMVRSRAIRALGNIPQALGFIAPSLEDPSRNVRIEAERVFSASGTPIPNEKAAAEWQAYLEFHGDRVDGAFLLAQEAIRKGQAEEAKRLITQAVSYDERAGGVRVQAAVLFSQLGDSAAAESELESALLYDPRNAYPHFSLGLLKWEQGAMDESITYFNNAVQLDPAFSRAWYNLGLAYSKVGRWIEARNALQGAARDMAQDPNWQQAYIAVERQLQMQQQSAPQNTDPNRQ